MEVKHYEEVKALKKILREKDVWLIQVVKELTIIKSQVANQDKIPVEETEMEMRVPKIESSSTTVVGFNEKERPCD